MLSSCSSFAISDGEMCINKTMARFAKKMQSEGINPSGIGGGIDHTNGKHNNLELVFMTSNIPDIESARKLIIKTIDKFLMEVNSNEEIRPFLVEHPFTIKHISIGILSESKRSGLSCVSNYKNELTYRQDNPDLNNLQSMDVHSETYEEAVRILSSQN